MNAPSYLDIEVVFKPRSPDGIILYNGERMDGSGDFLSINLIDGFVEFRFDPGNGPAIIRSLSPVNLDEWHTVRATRTARLGTLTVDDQAEVGGYSDGAFTMLSLPLNLFVGGVSDLKDVAREAELVQSFTGCVQKITVNGRNLVLSSNQANLLHGVNVADCPHICTSDPCSKGATCEPVKDSYTCRCPNGDGTECNQGTFNQFLFFSSIMPRINLGSEINSITVILINKIEINYLVNLSAIEMLIDTNDDIYLSASSFSRREILVCCKR